MSIPAIKPPNRPWKTWEKELLGTKRDHLVARKLGRTVQAVTAKRKTAKIPGQLVLKKWSPMEEKAFGTRSDEEIAQLLGRSVLLSGINATPWHCCYKVLGE